MRTGLAWHAGSIRQLHRCGQALPQCVLQSPHNTLFGPLQLISRLDARRLDARILQGTLQCLHTCIRCEVLAVLLLLCKGESHALQRLVPALAKPLLDGALRSCAPDRASVGGRTDRVTGQGGHIPAPADNDLRLVSRIQIRSGLFAPTLSCLLLLQDAQQITPAQTRRQSCEATQGEPRLHHNSPQTTACRLLLQYAKHIAPALIQRTA
mmetsp:Transcript_72973/g.163810  ORF Transcript_72973/g.163810 Transcript_72973/m.163810 type:complete len:210 (-) Transcript_72973:73-702(-)